MDSLFKSDVFFFITSCVVVLGGILLAVVLVYAIAIMRHISHVIGRARNEADKIISDVHDAKDRVKTALGLSRKEHDSKTSKKTYAKKQNEQ